MPACSASALKHWNACCAGRMECLSVSWLWTCSVDLTEHSWISTVMAETKVHSPPTSFPKAVVILAHGGQQTQAQHLPRLFSTIPQSLWLQPHRCHFTVKSLATSFSEWSCLCTCFPHIPHRKPGEQRTRWNWIHPVPRLFNVHCHKSELCSTKTCCRLNPHFFVSKTKVYCFSCQRSTDIIPLMIMKYQLPQWQMP